MVDLASKGMQGNIFAAWKNVRPHEKKFLEAIVGTNIHIIATMRTKTSWEVTKDEKTGRAKPIKIGLKPEQREGIEYEFTTVLELSVDGNVATTSKDRTSLFVGNPFVPSEKTGQELLVWLNSGADATLHTAPLEAGNATNGGNGHNGNSNYAAPTSKLLKRMYDNLKNMARGGGDLIIKAKMNEWLKDNGFAQVNSSKQLTTEQAQAITQWAYDEYQIFLRKEAANA